MSEQTLYPTERRRSWLLLALLLALTLAVFVPVCLQGFVDWDDSLHTYENPYFQPLTPYSLIHLWRVAYKGEYIPVSYMLFAWLSTLGQFSKPILTPDGGQTVLNPHVFHAANLCLHLLNVALVFGLLRRIVRKEGAAFAGALLFAVHPVQVESVAWISELRGLLGNGLGLLALHQYLSFAQAAESDRPVARRHYAVALVFFVLAILAKPSAVVIPLLALLLDLTVARRPLRRALTALAGWDAAAVPIMWLTRDAQPVAAALHLPFWQRPLVAGDAVAFYVFKLLLPMPLGIDYGRTPSVVLHGSSAVLTSLATVLVLLLVWRFARKTPLLLLAAGLFLAALLPVLGFVPFIFQRLSTVSDRYLYLALLGPALAVAWAGSRPALPRLLPVVYGVLVCVWVGLSLIQVRYWKDSLTLFTHAVAVDPHSGPMRYDLANALFNQNQVQPAIRQYQETLLLQPDDPATHCNLGTALAQSGDRAGAIIHLRLAERLDPRSVVAPTVLGLQYADAGQTDAAIQEWQTVIRLTPGDAATRYNLGCALSRQHRLPEAAAQFREVLRLEPDYPPALQALRVLARR